jgi:hypothetical protein
MSKPSWTWAAAATATLAGVAAAMLMTGASPARSDEDDETHTPSREFDVATSALDNWDSEIARENALAAYLGAGSRDDLLAPVEDPAYLDTH